MARETTSADRTKSSASNAGARVAAVNHCNLHKGPNMTGIDPVTGQSARLFHPRQDRWEDHFHWQGAVMGGRTVIGRATIRVLDANDPLLVAVRAGLMEEGFDFTPD